ncbi:MAG: adenylate/guanylate cyclase domain-containing protein [Alphaproteobacteria bacterium]
MDHKERPAGDRGRQLRFAAESLFLLVVITVLVMEVSKLGLFEGLERQIDDVAVAYFSEDVPAPHPRVAVVEIDDATIAARPPRSPISRALLADLLAVIDRGGALAIGVDVFLLEAQDPTSDAALTRTLAAMMTPVVLATFMGGDRKVRPLAQPFAESGVATALANLPVDLSDRTLRSYRAAFADGEGTLHSTMSAALARLAGAEVEASTRDQAIDWYGRPGWQDRPDAKSGAPLGPYPIVRYSALLLIEKPFLANFLKDRVVLVGATFEGSGDFHRTAFSRLGLGDEAFAGVFGHAHVLAQLLDGRSRTLPGLRFRLLAVILAALAGALLALLRVPVYVPLGLAVGAPVAWVAVVFLVRYQGGLALPALPPALGLAVSLAAFALFRARRFDRAQRIAAKALNSYLPRALARQVMNDPGMLRLGGEPRRLSMLFTDIAGFTSYAESHEPEEVVALLNEYLDGMAEIVLAHQGTLDKFIGDAVMAFFGAPGEAQTAHAAKAIACALEMDRYGHAFAARKGLKTRIGVHTGIAIVGNTGGERRFDYTVIGDAVNTAARLEGANRYLGLRPESATSVCISADTVAESRNDSADDLSLTGAERRQHPERQALRRVGRIQVKGREAPLGVYTTVPDWFAPEDLDTYNLGLERLEEGDYEAARAAFEALGEDQLSAFQVKRCIDGTGDFLKLEGK